MTMMVDKYDEQAERLLPCSEVCTALSSQILPRNQHGMFCPWGYRAGVAEALRAQDAKAYQHEHADILPCNQDTLYVRGREDEQRARDTVHVPHIAALKVQLADAKKQGMERAVEIAEGYFNAYDAQRAIRAEIEKELPLPGIACRCQFCGKSECECCDADVDPDIGDK